MQENSASANARQDASVGIVIANTETKASAASAEISLDPLDGVRGICSVVIVAGHILTFWAPKVDTSSWNTSVNGSDSSLYPDDWPQFGLDFLSAVTLFFVISGYTMVVVYDRRCDDPTSPRPLSTWSEQRVFFWKRVARLAPIYYLGLAIGIAPLIVYNDAVTIGLSVPLAMFWVQSLTYIGNLWDGPLWNVSAFAFCYLFFPVVLRNRTLSPSGLMWAIFWCTLTSWLSFTIFGVFFGQALSFLHIWAPFRLAHFFIGIFAGILAKKTSLPRPTLVAELCSLVLLASFIICAVIGANRIATWNFYAHLSEFLLVPVHALWIWALTSPGCSGPTRAVLLSRPLRVLGMLSYSLYCTHFPTISWCSWAVAGRGISYAAVPALNSQYCFNFPTWAILPLMAVCLVVATLAFYLVEEPTRIYLAGTSSKRSLSKAAPPLPPKEVPPVSDPPET